MLMIGTDADEWWHGQERRRLEASDSKRWASFPVTWDEIEAWEEGTVGWAAYEG